MEIRTVRNVVAGQHVETGTTFDAHHPVTGEVAARVRVSRALSRLATAMEEP